MPSCHGLNWPQAPVPEGTFDWQKVALAARIPADAKSVTLCLGLEEVSGHVLPSAIAVSLTKGMEVRPEGATGVPMPSCQVKLAN